MTEQSPAASMDKTVYNRRRAERRRQVSRTVSEVRAQLASPSGVTPDFDMELRANHARDRISAMVWLPAVGMTTGFVAAQWSDWIRVILWMTLALALQAIPLMLARRFLAVDPPPSEVARWRRRFVLADVIAALGWAVLFFLPITVQSASPIYPATAFLILIAAIAIPATSLPPALLGATVPVAVAAVSTLLFTWGGALGKTTEVYVLCLLIGAAEVFFVALGYRLLASTIAEVRSASEKDGLIAELEQANAISDDSRRRAEEANLAKSRFLATMSHELRTPLNAILGFSEVMQTEMLGPMGNATYKGYVTDIHDSGRHLLNLINEILDLSRIEAGRHQLSEEAVTLPFIAEDCVHMMTLRARNKGIALKEVYEDKLPRIWADERAIRQIILNILSNAVKFTPQGGTVTVKVGWTAGGGQYVSVRDTGPGISEEEIPIVLSAFGQGSIAIKSAEQGTGLGLNIVQALVKMHDGTFELKSKLREGTEVIITLPQTRVLDAVAPVDDRKRRRSSGMPIPVASVSMLEAMRNQAKSA
jgi:two-component system, cell cycle sensor histidine kinase PleC